MVQDVMRGEFLHYYKVFVKAEPHKLEKASIGRWRLIMMSALPFQVLWHMAVGHLEEAFLHYIGRHPLLHGQVFVGGGWKRYRHMVEVQNLRWTSDKSGWDWNSPGWIYEVCKELRIRLTQGATPEWERVLGLLYQDAYVDSKVLLPDGSVYQQSEPGLMKSGVVVTISDNGLAQIGLHRRAEKRLGLPPHHIKATGDDTIQEPPPDPEAYVAELQRGGCKVKEYSYGNDFMGFDILPTGFYPRYTGKHIVNLLYQKDEFLSETLESYARMYAYDTDMYNFWKEVARELKIPLPSRQYFLHFAGHPDALGNYGMRRPVFFDRVGDNGELTN